MNRLQYRHAFAKRYFERTGDYLAGWILSKDAADRSKIRVWSKQFIVDVRTMNMIVHGRNGPSFGFINNNKEKPPSLFFHRFRRFNK